MDPIKKEKIVSGIAVLIIFFLYLVGEIGALSCIVLSVGITISSLLLEISLQVEKMVNLMEENKKD